MSKNVLQLCPKSTCKKQDSNIGEAIEKAMLAHKAAKQTDKAEYLFYDDAMKKEAQRVQLIEDKMNGALENKEFKLYLQPQYRISDNSIAGMEALVRWQKKDGSLICPNDFIPIFEKNGFIAKLDYYMFEQVCRTIRRWIDNEMPEIIISVNLSRVHLKNTNLVSELCAIADRYRVPHGLLELELTETVAAENEPAVVVLAGQFHNAGMRLSIDDFGSGYSSLGILNYLAFDTLKLDRSFFKGLADSDRAKVIIQSIIRMAHQLNIMTIAEGIEEERQIAFLRQINCDVVQGFYYSKPLPSDAAARLLSESVQSRGVQREKVRTGFAAEP